MNDWQNYFFAQTGASAALTGLVFVAVSINLTRILTLEGLPGRAFEALTLLVSILISSSLMLVPGVSDTVRGLETLLIGVLAELIIIALQWLHLRQLEPQYRTIFFVRVGMAQVALLPFLVAGALLLAYPDGRGLYWFVPANIFGYLTAFLNAWILLVEINR